MLKWYYLSYDFACFRHLNVVPLQCLQDNIFLHKTHYYEPTNINNQIITAGRH